MKASCCTYPDRGVPDPSKRSCQDPLWNIEVQMPDGDTVNISIHGPQRRIIDDYAAQGAIVTRMTPIG
jgi:hypothetical protein